MLYASNKRMEYGQID